MKSFLIFLLVASYPVIADWHVAPMSRYHLGKLNVFRKASSHSC